MHYILHRGAGHEGPFVDQCFGSGSKVILFITRDRLRQIGGDGLVRDGGAEGPVCTLSGDFSGVFGLTSSLTGGGGGGRSAPPRAFEYTPHVCR